MQYQICLPIHREPDKAFLRLGRFCIPIYVDQEPVGRPIPPEDALAHLTVLATIARLAETLSESTPLRAELNDIAQQSLQSAVAGLGDGAELIVSDS